MLEIMARERVLLKQIRQKCVNTSQPEVSIIVSTNKPKYINNIFANYARLNYPCKEMVVILNNNKLNINDYRMKAVGLSEVRIFQLDESCTLGECLNFGIEQSKYNYISKMDDDDYYGTNYLTDLMNVFKYTDADITGKVSSFVYFEDSNTLSVRDNIIQYRYINTFPEYVIIKGSTILIKREILRKVKFQNLNSAEDTNFLIDCYMAGIKLYAADKYNYVCIRHKNLLDHTWRISSEGLMRISENFLVTKNFIPFIEV